MTGMESESACPVPGIVALVRGNGRNLRVAYGNKGDEIEDKWTTIAWWT